MILINKVTPFANENYYKDLIECLSHNSGISFIKNIVVFYNNSNIILPNNSKVKLIIKNGYSDYDIIEYCKRIYKDEVFIFSNPFVKFNNSLINLERPLKKTIKIENDCFIFNRNNVIGKSENIENLFESFESSDRITLDRKQIWSDDLRLTNIVKNDSNTRISRTLNIKNVKRKEQYLSKRSELKIVTPKIDVIIVSVDYNDFLSITLESTSKLFNVTVVTSPNDKECQELCRIYNVKCVITERMYEDGATFNKGKAINEGIKSLNRPEWILLLDADIYIKSDFLDILKKTDMRSQSLLICKRLIIEDYDSFVSWKSGEEVGRMERAKGFGYFQMFNINKFPINSTIFPESSNDASFSDLTFRDKFNKNEIHIDTYVVHLGKTCQNWEGRKTEKFKSITNEWGVVSNKKIKDSKYGKLNITNSINFDYHNGGWSNTLSELQNINNISGVIFNCFLESSFSWNGSSNEVYNEDWIGILHNPIDSESWYMNKFKNTDLFKSEGFVKSLSKCKGLYVFSDYEKFKVKDRLIKKGFNIKVESIKHTTKKISKKWSFADYSQNKKILHIGWWLRDVESFYKLKISKPKIRLKLNNKVESQLSQIFNLNSKDVKEIEYLENDDYDKIITSSIVYIKLIDAVAVNTILECIERNVPILTNRNISIEEYLGEDYPLFYDENSDLEYLTSDDMLIKASEYLNNIPRFLNLGRQIEQSGIYKSLNSEFNIKTIYEPGDLESSDGGIYNPGFCEFNGKKYMISRVENLTETERGNNEMWIKTTAVPYLTELDENLNIIESIKLEFIGDYKRVEDFRIFTHNGNLYSNHILIDSNINIKPVISIIDINKKTISVIGEVKLDFKIKDVEKNWVFLEKNNKLYLIYSVNPMIVYEVNIEDLTSTKVKDEVFNIDWSIKGYLSSSTNPIRVSYNRYIMGIHTRDANSIYHQGFLTFDDDFNIINCSINPYISGGDIYVIHKNVMYTSSIYLDGGKLICFAGDGDTKTIAIEIKKDNIWKELL